MPIAFQMLTYKTLFSPITTPTVSRDSRQQQSSRHNASLLFIGARMCYFYALLLTSCFYSSH